MWLGIDIGTGGTRALLVDAQGRIRAAFTAPHEDMRMERPLWAEQRPENWWDATVAAIRGVLQESGVAARDIRGIGLSGQMHGLVILDHAHQVIRPSLIWCDQRSQAQVDFINRTAGVENVLAWTANPVLTGFTLPKLLWVRDHEPQNFERVRQDAAAEGLRPLPLDRRIRQRRFGRFRHGDVRCGAARMGIEPDGQAGP